jgi:hypothetical protein
MMALLLPWPRRAAGTSDEERSTLLLLPSGCPVVTVGSSTGMSLIFSKLFSFMLQGYYVLALA